TYRDSRRLDLVHIIVQTGTINWNDILIFRGIISNGTPVLEHRGDCDNSHCRALEYSKHIWCVKRNRYNVSICNDRYKLSLNFYNYMYKDYDIRYLLACPIRAICIIHWFSRSNGCFEKTYFYTW